MKKNKIKSVLGITLIASALVTTTASHASVTKLSKKKKIQNVIKDSSEDLTTMKEGSKTEQVN